MPTRASTPALPRRELVGRLLWERWRRDAFVPGAEYREGCFFRFSGTRILAAKLWGPGSGAWMLDARERLRWRDAEPWLDATGANLRFPRARRPGLPWIDGEDPGARWSQLQLPFPGDDLACAWNQRVSALAAALAAVPRWALESVSRIDPGFQWRMLRWLDNAGEAGADLCQGNPALALLLAERGERLGLDPREAVLWRRRRLAGALGLPGREATVRLLAKVRCRGLRPDLALHVAGWLGDRDATTRVTHAQRIGLAGLMFRDGAELAWLDEALRLELLGTEDRDALGALYQYSEHARRLQRLGFAVRGRVGSLARLAGEAEALSQRFHRLRDVPAGRALAPPPVPEAPGFVETLRTVADVDVEAEEMRHCVLDYVPEALAGLVALYRVLQPERATLCLAQSAGGRWRISELRLKANRTPSPRTVREISTWLDANSPPLRAGRRSKRRARDAADASGARG